MHNLISGERGLIRLLCGFAFFDTFILIYPLYSLFMSDSGLSATQIASLLMAWSLTSFLLEIPSGILADKYPRKNILLIGIWLKAIGFLIWLIYPTYLGFLIGFILWGIKSSFSGGTQHALVYENLIKLKKRSLYQKVAGQMEAFSSAGLILGGVGASILAANGYSLILALSIVAIVLSAVAVHLIPSVHVRKPEAKPFRIKSHLGTSMRKVFKNSAILYVALIIAVITGFGVIDEYFALFLREKLLSNGQAAAWITLAYASGALGSLLSHKVNDKSLPVFGSFIGWGVLLIGASALSQPLAAFLLCVYMFYFSGLLVQVMAYMQHELDDRIRATALSIIGAVVELISLAVYAVIGFGALNSYANAYMLVGVLLLVVAILMAVGFKKITLQPAKD